MSEQNKTNDVNNSKIAIDDNDNYNDDNDNNYPGSFVFYPLLLNYGLLYPSSMLSLAMAPDSYVTSSDFTSVKLCEDNNSSDLIYLKLLDDSSAQINQGESRSKKYTNDTNIDDPVPLTDFDQWWIEHDIRGPCGCVRDETIECFDNYRENLQLTNYEKEGSKQIGAKNIIETYFKMSELSADGIAALCEILTMLKIIAEDRTGKNYYPLSYMNERFALSYDERDTILAFMDSESLVFHGCSLSYPGIDQAGRDFLDLHQDIAIEIEPFVLARLRSDGYKLPDPKRWFMEIVRDKTRCFVDSIPFVIGENDVIPFDSVEKSELFVHVLDYVDKNNLYDEKDMEINVLNGSTKGNPLSGGNELTRSLDSNQPVIYKCTFFQHQKNDTFMVVIFVNRSSKSSDFIKDRRLVYLGRKK